MRHWWWLRSPGNNNNNAANVNNDGSVNNNGNNVNNGNAGVRPALFPVMTRRLWYAPDPVSGIKESDSLSVYPGKYMTVGDSDMVSFQMIMQLQLMAATVLPFLYQISGTMSIREVYFGKKAE